MSKESMRRQSDKVQLNRRIKAWIDEGVGLEPFIGTEHLPDMKIATVNPIFAVSNTIEDQLVAENQGWRRPLANDLVVSNYVQGSMGDFLLKVRDTLRSRDSLKFDYNQIFVEKTVGKSLLEVKLAVVGATK